MKTKPNNSGFTLIELLVAMTILSVLLLLLTSLLDQVQKTWTSSRDRIGQYREARVAFDIISKNLSQASLNTYWDYHYDDNNVLDRYERRSELHFKTLFAAQDLAGKMGSGQFVSHGLFFQAPLGFSYGYKNLNNLFNGRGYFVVFGTDEKYRPKFVQAEDRYRYRLMEFRPPAEENQVFADGLAERSQDREVQLDKWWKHAESSVVSQSFEDNVQPLAENIIALVVSPRDTLEVSGENRRDTYSEIASNYEFDSSSIEDEKYSEQVPPLVRLTMVAIDETGAIRTEIPGGGFPDLVPDTLFRSTNKYDDDIEELTKILSDKGIDHKIFSTVVMLRSSRWSTFVVDEIE